MTSIEKSKLINDDEYRSFCVLIETKCKVLAVAVARLYKSDISEWKYFGTGMICLIKDNLNKRYCFQLFDMDKLSKVYDFMIKKNFIYINESEQVHTFDTQSGPVLLSFANANEANGFLGVVLGLIEQRKQQIAKKQEQQHTVTRNPVIQVSSNNNTRKSVTNNQTNKGKKKLTKEDIGKPIDFRHLDHMSLKDSFFQNPDDEHLRNFLKDKKMDYLLNNDQARQDIYELIESKGGFKQFTEEIEQENTRKTQQKIAPALPNRNYQSQYVAPSVKPTQQATKNHPPLPPNSNFPPSSNVPPPPGPAPPPPPPPPAPAPMAPGPPAIPKPGGGMNKPAPIAAPVVGLLSEIERFNKDALKSKDIPKQELKQEETDSVHGGSILESLAKFIENRADLMKPTSDSDDSDDDDEDPEEWED